MNAVCQTELQRTPHKSDTRTHTDIQTREEAALLKRDGTLQVSHHVTRRNATL
jgi:hypothetical protein